MSDDLKREQILSRLTNHASKLSATLDELASAGGLGALSRGMRPASVEKLAGALREVRKSLDEQLGQLKPPRPRPKPRPAPAPAGPPDPVQTPPASEADARPIRRAAR